MLGAPKLGLFTAPCKSHSPSEFQFVPVIHQASINDSRQDLRLRDFGSCNACDIIREHDQVGWVPRQQIAATIFLTDREGRSGSEVVQRRLRRNTLFGIENLPLAGA